MPRTVELAFCCPNCNHDLNAPLHQLGGEITCSSCAHTFKVGRLVDFGWAADSTPSHEWAKAVVHVPITCHQAVSEVEMGRVHTAMDGRTTGTTVHRTHFAGGLAHTSYQTNTTLELPAEGRREQRFSCPFCHKTMTIVTRNLNALNRKSRSIPLTLALSGVTLILVNMCLGIEYDARYPTWLAGLLFLTGLALFSGGGVVLYRRTPRLSAYIANVSIEGEDYCEHVRSGMNVRYASQHSFG